MNEGKTPASVSFTEEMKGYLTFGTTNFEDGYREGKKSDTYFMFHLTIRTDDIDRFASSAEQEAVAEGYVQCQKLGGRRPVERGVFNLLVDTESRKTKRMHYRLHFSDDKGKPLTLVGFKDVQDNVGPDIWSDTTTLYTNLVEGHVEKAGDPSAKIVAAGVLRILVLDFLHQLTTFKAEAPTFQERSRALEKFGKVFLGGLWAVYGPSFMPKVDPYEREIPLYTTEGVRDAEISTHAFPTADKLGLSLLRFKREPCQDVVIVAHGLTTSSDMFIMPEHYNLVSYLLDNGFGDVWTLDYRMSNRFPYNLRRNRFNMDDIALYDFPAALRTVRQTVGPQCRIHLICHCLGSVSFAMALFGKTVDGVSSAILNSVALTPRIPGWSKVKLAVAPFVCDYLLGIEYINPWWRRESGWSVGQIMAWGVSFFHRECNVPACHMLSFMWGTGFPALYWHENLLDVTHRRGADLYGGVSLNYFRHVRKMVKAGCAVKYDVSNPKYTSLPDNYMQAAGEIETPILFTTGEVNNVFRDSNIVCHQSLEKVAPGRHQLHVFPRYGHQDVFMGKNCHQDIFPRLVQFIRERGVPRPAQVAV